MSTKHCLDDENIQLKQDIETILEGLKNKDETLNLLNKMKKKYKIALFMVIRNSMVMPKEIKLGKSEKEINKMAYKTMCEVITMIDFNRANEIYEQAKED